MLPYVFYLQSLEKKQTIPSLNWKLKLEIDAQSVMIISGGRMLICSDRKLIPYSPSVVSVVCSVVFFS